MTARDERLILSADAGAGSARAGFLDLADFLTWKATGDLARSTCTVTCKWTYLANENRWDPTYFRQMGLDGLADEDCVRISVQVVDPGTPLSEAAAADLGLLPGTPVSAGMIDAHASGISTRRDREQPRHLHGLHFRHLLLHDDLDSGAGLRTRRLVRRRRRHQPSDRMPPRQRCSTGSSPRPRDPGLGLSDRASRYCNARALGSDPLRRRPPCSVRIPRQPRATCRPCPCGNRQLRDWAQSRQPRRALACRDPQHRLRAAANHRGAGQSRCIHREGGDLGRCRVVRADPPDPRRHLCKPILACQAEEPVLLGTVAARLHPDLPSPMTELSHACAACVPAEGATRALHANGYEAFRRLQAPAREIR